MSDLLQHLFVTLVAFGAAVVLLRRLFFVVRPSGDKPACPSCASPGAAACAKPGPGQAPSDAHPIVVLERPARR